MGYWTNRTIRGFARGLSAPARMILSEKNAGRGTGGAWVIAPFLFLVALVGLIFGGPILAVTNKYQNQLRERSVLGRVEKTLENKSRWTSTTQSMTNRAYIFAVFIYFVAAMATALALQGFYRAPTFGLDVVVRGNPFGMTAIYFAFASIAWILVRRLFLYLHVSQLNARLEKLGYPKNVYLAKAPDFNRYEGKFFKQLREGRS
jgi:hypothetical protein